VAGPKPHQQITVTEIIAAFWTHAKASYRRHGLPTGIHENYRPVLEFAATMQKYQALLSYHEPTGQSVRGSIAGELVARCVVEALASTLYDVLADAAPDVTTRVMYTTLAQDEARHLGMFLGWQFADGPRSVWPS
jgi:hypothetical protein